MKTYLTSELEGAALDWAVAMAVNGSEALIDAFGIEAWGLNITNAVEDGRIKPSTDWSQGGPLIERLEMLSHLHGFWYAIPGEDVIELEGETPLIAAMRAIVAAELGDSVDVPEGFGRGA